MKRQVARKRGNKRGTHRPFREEIADEIGNPERDNERVHLVAGAEQRREDLLAGEPEGAAGQRGRTAQTG